MELNGVEWNRNGMEFIRNFLFWRMAGNDVVWYDAVRYTRRCTVQWCTDIVGIMAWKAVRLVLS